ncbi:MAG TPA: DUF58 domain-containing protein [Gammaproteobacteria bacterium]|nr:DUF58 domain-containing protein [Gammaproteobacteria bacterium]
MHTKNQLYLQHPLLDSVAINQCIAQGMRWNGHTLPWPMREIHQGSTGDIKSQQQGSGIDLCEIRPYQPGDEIRHINWRATARTGRTQVRVFHKDLTPHCYFLIDRRASMRFGTRIRLKVTQAARLSIFLASWEAQKGNALGGLVLNETPRWLPPINGLQAVHQLAQLASSACPPSNTAPDPDPELNFQYSLSLLNEKIPPGSHVYLLSDFYDLDREMKSQLHQLGQQHHVLAIGIYDSAEQLLPNAGFLKLFWGKQKSLKNSPLINTCDRDIQYSYHLKFEKKRKHIEQLFKKTAISYISVCSQSSDIEEALKTSPI